MLLEQVCGTHEPYNRSRSQASLFRAIPALDRLLLYLISLFAIFPFVHTCEMFKQSEFQTLDPERGSRSLARAIDRAGASSRAPPGTATSTRVANHNGPLLSIAIANGFVAVDILAEATASDCDDLAIEAGSVEKWVRFDLRAHHM